MKKDEVTIETLIARVFQARDITHFKHLTTDSFALHSALGTFYDQVIDKIDNVVENYIGSFGEIDDLPEMDRKQPKDIISYLQDEADWIESNRDVLSNGSDNIAALLDDLAEAYTHTVYRLGLK